MRDGAFRLAPTSPLEGPPLPRLLDIKWPWVSSSHHGSDSSSYEAEDTTGAKMIKALVVGTINDISFEKMSRIVHRLNRMSREDRDYPKRVADVLAEELGVAKSLQYIDKALAAGTIKLREYEQMRAALILTIPRAEIPKPLVAQAAQELIETQKRLQQEFGHLSEAGKQAFQKTFREVDEDARRLRRAWGLR